MTHTTQKTYFTIRMLRRRGQDIDVRGEYETYEEALDFAKYNYGRFADYGKDLPDNIEIVKHEE